MLTRLTTILFLGLAAASCAVNATNYVGLDYKYRSMLGNTKQNYSMRQVLSKSYSSAEIYATHRFANNVGINIGFEQSKNQDQSHTFVANESFLGDSQAAGDTTFTRVQIRAAHFDISGFLNIHNKLEAIGQLGAAFMQINIKGHTTVGSVSTNMNASKSYKVIPRVGMGLQYFMTRSFGVRCLLNWEGTNMYKMHITDEDGVRRYIKPYKQSWTAAIGIVGKF